DRRQIEDDPCASILANLAQEGLPQLRRRGEVDVSRDVEDGDLVQLARRNLHCGISSRVPWGPRDTKKLHESEPIPAGRSVKSYRIHVFPYEVQAQAARAHLIERPSAHLRSIDPPASIHEIDLERFPTRPVPGRSNAVERHFDGATRMSSIGVAN